MVVRSALCGLQSPADSGACSHTGHELGSVAWHVSQMACSQQGRRNALTASLLQMAQRSLAGMSSCGRELGLGLSATQRVSEGGEAGVPDELDLRFCEAQRGGHFHFVLLGRAAVHGHVATPRERV